MKPNPILEEIRHTRDELARRSGYNVRKFMDQIREREREATARGEKFEHCVLGEPSNVEVLGDCIKVGRRGSQSGTLYVDGVQGHVAYPHRAANPVPDISRLIVAISDEPLDRGSAQAPPTQLVRSGVERVGQSPKALLNVREG